MRKWVAGIVIYPAIFYNTRDHFIDDVTRRHEWQHVAQVERDGWIKFYFRWLWQAMRNGYSHIDYEIEAYTVQHDGKKPWENRHIKIIDKPDD